MRHAALRARVAALDEGVDAAFSGGIDRVLARIADAQGLGSGGRTGQAALRTGEA